MADGILDDGENLVLEVLLHVMLDEEVGPVESSKGVVDLASLEEEVVDAINGEADEDNSQKDDVANLLPLGAHAAAREVGLVREVQLGCLGHVWEDVLISQASPIGHRGSERAKKKISNGSLLFADL